MQKSKRLNESDGFAVSFFKAAVVFVLIIGAAFLARTYGHVHFGVIGMIVVIILAFVIATIVGVRSFTKWWDNLDGPVTDPHEGGAL